MNDNILKLDGIDKEIVRMLMTNSRRPILEIAKKLASLELLYTKDSENWKNKI